MTKDAQMIFNSCVRASLGVPKAPTLCAAVWLFCGLRGGSARQAANDFDLNLDTIYQHLKRARRKPHVKRIARAALSLLEASRVVA